MAILLTVENFGARHRAAVVAFALLGLATIAACVWAPAPIGPEPVDDEAASAPPDVGVFSGRYLDDMPIYVFPPIVVVGRRSPD